MKRFYFLYFKIPLKQLRYLNGGSFVKLNFPPLFLRQKRLISLQLKGIQHPIYVRSHSLIDRSVLHYVFYRSYHLPPPGLGMPEVPIILDLGSNIGMTMLDFQRHYPKAQIFGYEMDQENFSIAQKNCQPYSALHIHHQAIWTEKKTLYYDALSDADAYQLSESDADQKNQKIAVETIRIADILAEKNLEVVDYLKMDIEGAEIAIFNSQQLDWLDKVRILNLEIHQEALENPQFILKVLENKGFTTKMDSKEGNSILAYRSPEA
ncbi:MAG: FkbM family methyltransferase [Bacteroidota bacterium]